MARPYISLEEFRKLRQEKADEDWYKLYISKSKENKRKFIEEDYKTAFAFFTIYHNDKTGLEMIAENEQLPVNIRAASYRILRRNKEADKLVPEAIPFTEKELEKRIGFNPFEVKSSSGWIIPRRHHDSGDTMSPLQKVAFKLLEDD